MTRWRTLFSTFPITTFPLSLLIERSYDNGTLDWVWKMNSILNLMNLKDVNVWIVETFLVSFATKRLPNRVERTLSGNVISDGMENFIKTNVRPHWSWPYQEWTLWAKSLKGTHSFENRTMNVILPTGHPPVSEMQILLELNPLWWEKPLRKTDIQWSVEIKEYCKYSSSASTLYADEREDMDTSILVKSIHWKEKRRPIFVLRNLSRSDYINIHRVWCLCVWSGDFLYNTLQ